MDVPGNFHIQVMMFLYGDLGSGTSFSLFGETKAAVAERLTGVIQQIMTVGWYSADTGMVRLVPAPIRHTVYSPSGFSNEELVEISNEAIQALRSVKR